MSNFKQTYICWIYSIRNKEISNVCFSLWIYENDFWNDFKLLFTDTDSLCYEICNEIPYEKFYKHREYFDLITLKIVNIFVMIIKKY